MNKVIRTQCNCGCKSLKPIEKLFIGLSYDLKLANCLSCYTTLVIEKIEKKKAA